MEFDEDKFRATVSLYDKDGNYIDTASGNAMEVIAALPDIPKSVYVLDYYKDHSYLQIVTDTHFGCRCRKRGGLYLTESMYCNWLMNECIKDIKKGKYDSFSFDTIVYKSLNIALREEYETNKQGFEEWSESYFDDNPIWNYVDDLNEVAGKKGIYALVLDRYKMCYIGQSENIKTRILAHWSKDNWFTTGIDMFRAKDTTRIYYIAAQKKELNVAEYVLIKDVPIKYILNVLTASALEYLYGIRDNTPDESLKTTEDIFNAVEESYKLRHPWHLSYRDFKRTSAQYYDKYLVTKKVSGI